MKKIINDPINSVEEMIEGVTYAFPDHYEKIPEINGIKYKYNDRNKVAVIIGGGSGHEPLFYGFVGKNLADAAAVGNFFASPDPYTILNTIRSVYNPCGAICLFGNYDGDVLNFQIAAEMAASEGMNIKLCPVCDDILSAPASEKNRRRGIAGDVYMFKIAGAAASLQYDIEKVYEVLKKTNENIFSVGIALSAASIPGHEKNFEISDDEMEFGMGLHGEPGVKRIPFENAKKMAKKMTDEILNEMNCSETDEIAVLINGLGSTTLLELNILYKEVHEYIKSKNISIYDSDIGQYCTSQEMAGASLTIMRLDEQIKELLKVPVYSPYYYKNGGKNENT